MLEAPAEDGTVLAIDCPPTFASRWTCGAILRGQTYPDIPFVGEVRTIVDAGANVGAATTYFAHHHPDATIHAVEPAAEARDYLLRNVGALPQVRVHELGLSDADGVARLFHHPTDLGQSSVVDDGTAAGSEEVSLRAAGPWAAAEGIEAIDVLKVDVEGCEVAVLESLGSLLATVKVLYVEYDDRRARRRIEELLGATHELYLGMVFLDQGECTYVRADLLTDREQSRQHLLALLSARQAGNGQ